MVLINDKRQVSSYLLHKTSIKANLKLFIVLYVMFIEGENTMNVVRKEEKENAIYLSI